MADHTFDAGHDYPFGPSAAIAVADVDIDGSMDLVLVDGGKVRVLYGNGDGTFGSSDVLGMNGEARSVSPAELDPQADAELVIARAGGVSVWPGTDAGITELPTPFEPRYAAAGDVDGDGTLDIVVTTDDAVGVLLNDCAQ